MKKVYRILIATAITLIILTISVFIMIGILNIQNPTILAIICVITWTTSYRLIKGKPKSKPELMEVFWESSDTSSEPIIKERGHTLNGERVGEWDQFSASGEFLQTIDYSEKRS
jgi:hypothetical protein